MLYVLCLMHGAMLGQATLSAPTPAAPVPAITLLQPLTVDDAPSDPPKSANTETITPEAPPPFSIFSRPYFADRTGLSFIYGSGPGRFNIIDWESRPNRDRYWWLGRWPVPEDVQLHAGLGFNVHWWAGPVQYDAQPPPPNLPPRVYDLYLDMSWSQRWSDRLTSEVRFRPGLYTDFRTTPPDAFRVPGEAVGVYQVDPNLYLVGGVEYLQRNDIKVLPIAGVLWQPTPRWEIGLIFPEPKIAFELSTQQHLWGYIAGQYGGGRWTIKNDLGHSGRVEYSDFRLMFGIEWREDYLGKLPLLPQTAAAFLETGYVFERHLRFATTASQFDPQPAWMIRFGSVW